MLDYHAIFSAESKTYQKWQSILLAHTHKQVQQPGSLICLLAGQEDPNFLSGFPGQILSTRLAAKTSVNGDDFPGFNRDAAISDYLSTIPPGDQIYILLDPDMVFTRAWTPILDTNEEIAESMWYMDSAKESGRSVIKRYARKNQDKVQAFGFPLVMRDSALREVIGRQNELTKILRSDLWVRQQINWVCDMWSLTIACAELGVRFRCERNCSFTGEQETNRPLIHYTYSTQSPSGYFWDKRSYVPWNPLPPLKPDVPAAGRIFYEIFNKFLKEEKHETRL